MRPELPLIQCLRYASSRIALVVFLGFSVAFPLRAETQKPNLPDPVKFVNKVDIVANVVRAVLEDMNLQIELEDRKSGKIVTRPYEFITGSLTSSEVAKVAVKKDTITGSWLKARYAVEALFEIVSPTETMVTVRTKMEALNREVDGTEKWLPLDSLGVYERRVLSKISMKLLGNDTNIYDNKGFWGKTPQPVDSRPPGFRPPPPGKYCVS